MLELVSQVENEKLCNFTDWVGDRWYDFETWIEKLNIRNYINNVNAYHKKVIDKNNTTISTIESIFGKVRSADNQYYTIFKDKHTRLGSWKEYIIELSGIINPVNGKFKNGIHFFFHGGEVGRTSELHKLMGKGDDRRVS